MYRYFLVLATVSLVVGQRLRPPLNPPLQPPSGMVLVYIMLVHGLYISGQRCAGRNYNGRRCCTPELPCGYGEGDCDGPGDGGTNDGHRGCQRGQGVVVVIVIVTQRYSAQAWCAAATTASSSASTTTRRTTAATCPSPGPQWRGSAPGY